MRTSAKTADEMALDIMLSNAPARVRQERLAKLAKVAATAIGDECPACGFDVTETTGHGEYRCCSCDHRWGGESCT